uniref:Uncharacterized protein n=1 Tax=Glossina pallidipes TaxID=7398 RepID=A0A1B0A527_GLOPL
MVTPSFGGQMTCVLFDYLPYIMVGEYEQDLLDQLDLWLPLIGMNIFFLQPPVKLLAAEAKSTYLDADQEYEYFDIYFNLIVVFNNKEKWQTALMGCTSWAYCYTEFCVLNILQLEKRNKTPFSRRLNEDEYPASAQQIKGLSANTNDPLKH